MKLSVTYTLEINKQSIALTKDQAEDLYFQLGLLLNKDKPVTMPYPIINPPAAPNSPYPWSPTVTYGDGVQVLKRSIG